MPTKRAGLERFFRQGDYDQVVFIGCGSTHYLSLVAASIYQSLVGVNARALPSSEVLLHPESCLLEEGHTLLVAISRSGATTETLEAVRVARESFGADVIGITCYEGSPLAVECSPCLVAGAAVESSIAQTRSFSSMLLMSQFLASVAAERDDYWEEVHEALSLGESTVAQASALAAELGPVDTCRRLVYLGSGPCYGLAREAALKMTEISLSTAEAYHTLEYRHGPKSTLNEGTLIVGLLPDKGRKQETAVFKEMRGLGARALAMGAGCEPGDGDYIFQMDSGTSDLSRLVLYMPLLQLLAYHRGMSKGLDPDRPRNLQAVVRLQAS
jgi:glucosamine--fructose-6-phosphate aminotransferase (isomerizing)